MSQSGLTVRSHWHLRCQEITVPVNEFYELVKSHLTTKKVPNVETSSVTWREGGITSAKRIYLRITLGTNIFDVCTAPYADGSFFSCWSAEKRPSALWAIGIFLALYFLGVFMFFVLILGWGVGGFILWSLGFATALVLIPFFLANAPREMAQYVWVVPWVGPFLENIFSPDTYYRTDTSIMAEQAVFEAVQDAVGEVTKAQGFRALTESDKKPVYKALLR